MTAVPSSDHGPSPASLPPPGTPAGPSRRLAAVLLADVAGYSRMMERDEAATHRRLCEVRDSIANPAIARHHGRAVRSKGDDLLVEFASAIEALSCAIEIQRAMAEYNRDLAVGSRIDLRIGINLGDILIDGDEIVGDGVNVAARLESLAEPGGIAISRAVREQVRQLVGVRLSDAGQYRVKNISRPIRVFRVNLDAADRPLYGRFAARWLRWAAAATAAALLLAALLLVPWQTWQVGEVWRSDVPAQSLALLPVVDRTGDGTGKPLAEALTAQLTSALAQSVGGPVASASVAAAHASPGIDARQAGRALGVRYVAEASVLAAGERTRVAAQLISTQSGAQLWHTTLDTARVPGEAVPLELVGRLTETLAAEIRSAELQLAAAEDRSDARILSLRARSRMPATETLDDLRQVRQLYEEALRLQPDYPPALSGLASALAYESDRVFDPVQKGALLKRADEVSLRAIGLPGADAEAWRARALVVSFRGQIDTAEQAIERALMLNPYAGETHGQHGLVLTRLGRLDDALLAFDRAIRLNPGGESIGVYLYNRARALLLLGRYQEAIDTGRRALAFAPDWPDFMVLAAAYAMHGDAAAAAEARAELLRREPRFTITWLMEATSVGNARALQQRNTHLIAGLRRAGVPER